MKRRFRKLYSPRKSGKYTLIERIWLSLNTQFLLENAKFFRNALVLASIGQYSEFNHLENPLSDATTSASKNYHYTKDSQL